MDGFARAFIMSSLFWLLFGLTGGLTMIWAPGLRPYLLFPHVHANLLGWVCMMIYGVGYHVLPRFAGNPVYSQRLGWTHFALTNLGLLGMTTFGILVAVAGWEPGGQVWQHALGLSGTLEAAGILCFIANIGLSMKPKPGIQKEGWEKYQSAGPPAQPAPQATAPTYR